ncbi:class I SAM-dependent methyltransferase [Paraburkholderia humisilvae]|uniref:2-methoxy-6-polyprenyl-1,4-benzoquinol methylase, mitochondrial n=1 Tax=Paraburkholderia humisilvae TaxID=627669 RepID=A0A6J5EA57_9BURK|nr:class I SAM-dependent methyltransferase [Paraburkholderia humisilvae]CAB3762032.1 2-methoxy-6-polyprenyl-1,4-benzoquinol methylase, mitochondrial [Paraburkholderia humisilvae]
MKDDAYRDINDLYLSMVSPEEVLASDIHDPVMSDWIATSLPDQASILDAGCGMGYHMVALHRGLPAKQTGKRYRVFGADYSESMLKSARANGMKAGIPADAYRQSAFADLKHIEPWSAKFDCVLINYAIYSYPDSVHDYDAYFRDCLAGVNHVLRPGGHLLFNVRDWASVVSGPKDHDYVNTHDGITYHCRYSWEFGPDRHHKAHVTMRNRASDLKRETMLRFAERTPNELMALMEKHGYEWVSTQPHGAGILKFDTLIARRLA